MKSLPSFTAMCTLNVIVKNGLEYHGNIRDSPGFLEFVPGPRTLRKLSRKNPYPRSLRNKPRRNGGKYVML